MYSNIIQIQHMHYKVNTTLQCSLGIFNEEDEIDSKLKTQHFKTQHFSVRIFNEEDEIDSKLKTKHFSDGIFKKENEIDFTKLTIQYLVTV